MKSKVSLEWSQWDLSNELLFVITHITSFGVTAWTRVTAWTCMCELPRLIVHWTRISMYIGYWTLNNYYYYCHDQMKLIFMVVPTNWHCRFRLLKSFWHGTSWWSPLVNSSREVCVIWMYFIWRRKRKMERGCKGFERWYGGIWNVDTMWEVEKIEKETMRYLTVMWNSRQRHERWRECGLEWCVTVCMEMRKRMEW